MQPPGETFAQGENIGWFLDPPVTVKLFNLFGAQPFDVKRTARYEMFQLFNRLGRANHAASTPTDCIAFFANGIGPAFWANGRKIEWGGVLGALCQINIRNFRDNITRAIDLHPVAHTNVFAAANLSSLGIAADDVILVVQGRV